MRVGRRSATGTGYSYLPILHAIQAFSSASKYVPGTHPSVGSAVGVAEGSGVGMAVGLGVGSVVGVGDGGCVKYVGPWLG